MKSEAGQARKEDHVDPYKTLKHAAMYIHQFIPQFPEPMTKAGDAEVWAIEILAVSALDVLNSSH